MTIRDRAIQLLKEVKIRSTTVDYNAIAAIIRRERPNANTSDKSIRWYHSMFRSEIDGAQLSGTSSEPVGPAEADTSLTSAAETEEAAETDDLVEIALNLNNDPKEIENWECAEDLIVAYEATQHRQAQKVTSRDQQNMAGYDICSISIRCDEQGKPVETRHIEVKSKKKGKFAWLQLTANETAQLLKDPNYWLYLVEGNARSGKVKLVAVNRADLLEMLSLKIVARFSRFAGRKRKSIGD